MSLGRPRSQAAPRVNSSGRDMLVMSPVRLVLARMPVAPLACSAAAPPGTWNIHLQTHGDLLLVINAKDMFAAAEFADEKAYYKGQLGKVVGTADPSASEAELAEMMVGRSVKLTVDKDAAEPGKPASGPPWTGWPAASRGRRRRTR